MLYDILILDIFNGCYMTTINYKSNLRVLLAKKRLSIRAFSELSGISTVTLSKISNDKLDSTTLGTLKKICSILECSLKDLIEY